MAPTRIRKAKAYSMHGFVTPVDGGALGDYPALIGKLSEEYRRVKYKQRGEVIAIVDTYKAYGLIAFRFVSGSEDTITIYDQNTGNAIEEKLPKGQLSASTSWLICNPEHRIVFIESRRPGVTPEKMRKLIREFGRKNLGYAEFEFEFHPVAAANFDSEIGRFSRIREVDLVLSRPNKDWLPASLLAGAASDSNAQTVEIGTKAARNKSLAKDRGIVDAIRRYSRKKITALKEVRVFGSVPGKDGEQVVKLTENQCAVTSRIGTDATELEVIGTLMREVSETDLGELPTEEE